MDSNSTPTLPNNLTPISIPIPDDFEKLLLSPEIRKHAAIQMQNQILSNMTSQENYDFVNINPNEKVEGLLAETNEKLNQQLLQYESANNELKQQLEYTKQQLKQLNDKESSQNLYIKELKADLREEALKRELAENKLSAKDWKIALISGIIGLIVGFICAYFSFYLTTL